MRDLLARLRAVLSPQALLLLICAMLFFACSACLSGGESASALERRAENVLSGVSGAGRVSVVIHMRDVQGTGGGLSAKAASRIPAGAVAVAQGADDPVVHYQLQQALCALLSLPASAVSIVTGGK